MLKEYNKEKLHEYAKELFALCLEKGFDLHSDSNIGLCVVANNKKYTSYLEKEVYTTKRKYASSKEVLPIWELIEKVKQL